ncbi:MAG TPA: hypothetical protein DCZ80_03915 [Legionellales bacterium]|nr:hypothetical protein [Legionellales bacterium]
MKLATFRSKSNLYQRCLSNY